jgi:hypothetical protein
MDQDMKIMRRYTDSETGETVVEVTDLSFLKNPSHPFGWFRRHFLHHWLKWALRHSDRIVAADEETAFDIHRFYFIPRERIRIIPR